MRYTLLLLATLLVAGCSDPSWEAKDISGLMKPLEFNLVDENGQEVEGSDFRGKVTVVFFGFTHCPDICPTTLARFSRIVDAIEPEQRDDLRVLFVSVDPARDDPQTLREYTDAFGPEFVGLTGDREALDELTRRYRVTYGYGDKNEAGDYDVSHSSALFAFRRDGGAQLLIRDSDPTEAVIADIRRLLAAG